MKQKKPWRRWGSLVAVVAVAGAVSVGYLATTASAKRAETITLRVSLFGDFGYHDLYKQYEASHPGIEIKEEIQDFGAHHTQLAQRLATGAGAAGSSIPSRPALSPAWRRRQHRSRCYADAMARTLRASCAQRKQRPLQP